MACILKYMACIFYNMPYVFFCMVQERKKTGFCGWKNKNKTDRNAIGFYVHLIGLEPTQPKLPDPKSGASTNSATGARCLELQI